MPGKGLDPGEITERRERYKSKNILRFGAQITRHSDPRKIVCHSFLFLLPHLQAPVCLIVPSISIPPNYQPFHIPFLQLSLLIHKWGQKQAFAHQFIVRNKKPIQCKVISTKEMSAVVIVIITIVFITVINHSRHHCHQYHLHRHHGCHHLFLILLP